MAASWPALSYEEWSETCDTLHAHTQLLGKLAVALAPPEPQFQHVALPVNAWWGSFDLAVNLFSGRPADPPSDDYIMRNAMDAEEVAVGWWPGDARYGHPAFYAYAHPPRDGFADAPMSPGRWDGGLGEYLLDWDEARSAPEPQGVAVDFARRAFRHACAGREWDDALA